MKAFVLTADGRGHAELPDPRPGLGQVVVRTTAAGLCHSDLTLAAREPSAHPFKLPMTLGHELAGTIVEVAPDVTGWHTGDPVVGYGPRGCGQCDRCRDGAENYCRTPPTAAIPGLGAHGALAEYVSVDARSLLRADDVDPEQGAALTDAGLTAHHALGRALAVGAAAVAEVPVVVVIGIGGLGHLAIQLAKLAGAHVIAIDRLDAKLALGRRVGADRVLASGSEVVAQVHDLVGGGVDVVLDFVASSETLTQAGAMVGRDGVVSIVGVGAGRLPVGMHALPLGVRTDLPFWGTRPELRQLLDLAASGQLSVEVETHRFEETAFAYGRLARGEVLGRAVICPNP